MNSETGFLKIRRIFSSIAGTIILAAIPSIIIFIITPVKARKYILETVKTNSYPENTFVYYDDLNFDGFSETISVFDSRNTSGLTIFEKGRTIDQWNIKGSFSFILKESLFITADCDGNGLKEIYIFSISNDSILLSCLPSIYESDLSIRNRFIATVGPGSKAPDPSIVKAEAEDLDDDGRKELIFGIMTGFSKFPRRIYAYYIEKDSLVVSPESSSFLIGITQADINNDGKNEIIPYGYAARNISPEEAKYHDYSAWLMVLDKNLKFLFEPVEFVGKFKHLIPIIDTQNGTITELLSFSQDKDSAAFICGFDKTGRILYRNYPGIEAINGFLTWDKRNPVYVFNTYDGFYTCYRNKKVLRKENISGFFRQIDIDLDGLKEIIIYSQEESRLLVYRSGFIQPAECKIEWNASIEEIISVEHKVGDFPLLSFQSGGIHYLIKYSPNSLYYWSFAYYPIVFSAFIGFVLFIQLLQRKRIERKFETERKISDLQLAMLRNQLDPHFTLNAINSVISSINNSEKESAVLVLRKFAGLYRTMVLSAGKSRRSLDDEINFSNEYLALEKIRFNGRFDYRFEISEDVNRSLEVPKMLIQFFAENAVKHAFNDAEVQGRLVIRIFNENNGLNINIEDNGIGRIRASFQKQDSTHKGYEIITELFKVYNKYYTEKIGFDIIDLVNEENNPLGTKIIIRIK